MATAVYNYVTIIDAIRLALNWKGTDKIITDTEIKGFIYENIESQESSYTFQKITTGLYKYFHGEGDRFALWLPSFTGTADVVYTINCRGSIEVTSGTEAATEIAVTGTPVNFAACMVQILHMLATHRCQEISVSAGTGNESAAQIHTQLLEMADYWQGIEQIA